MGCDMYCVVEALNKENKTWDCFGVSSADRDYSLFSRIGDVRNSDKEETYIEPIAAYRGWPWGDGVTGPAEAWSNSKELTHSETWLNRIELEELNKWTMETQNTNLWKKLGFDHLSYFFSFMDGWVKAAFTRYSDLRVLFFFSG